MTTGVSHIASNRQHRLSDQVLANTFKTQVRDITRRTRGISLPQLIEELRPYLIGWRGYFGFCPTPRVLTNLEAWIRRRLRSYLWRQWHKIWVKGVYMGQECLCEGRQSQTPASGPAAA